MPRADYLHGLCKAVDWDPLEPNSKWNQVLEDFLNNSTRLSKSKLKRQILWKDHNGFNSFHIVCTKYPPLRIVEAMIDIAGEEIVSDNSNEDKSTPLHMMAFSGTNKLGIVQLLIDIGGENLLMLQNSSGNTALHHSCHNDYDLRSDEVVELLVERGGEELVNIRNDKGETAMHVNNGKYADTITEVLDEMKQNQNKYVNFSWLCMIQEWDQVQQYLRGSTSHEMKKKKITRRNTGGWNHLHTACWKGCPAEIFRLMIEIAGVDAVFAKTNDGSTPLHVTCRACSSHKDIRAGIIEALVAFGGKKLLMMQNGNGDTALHGACNGDDKHEIVQFLVKHGGKELVDVCNNDGETAMHIKGGKYAKTIIETLRGNQKAANKEEKRIPSNICHEQDDLSLQVHDSQGKKQQKQQKQQKNKGKTKCKTIIKDDNALVATKRKPLTDIERNTLESSKGEITQDAEAYHKRSTAVVAPEQGVSPNPTDQSSLKKIDKDKKANTKPNCADNDNRDIPADVFVNSTILMAEYSLELDFVLRIQSFCTAGSITADITIRCESEEADNNTLEQVLKLHQETSCTKVTHLNVDDQLFLPWDEAKSFLVSNLWYINFLDELLYQYREHEYYCK
mmetsp:Transcript_17576/g.26188  ORF Transcript_17576/g.26188 Transcript_17576/m.26188 type:complete len:620 (-) Transcript_17576:38-1897(-)